MKVWKNIRWYAATLWWFCVWSTLLFMLLHPGAARGAHAEDGVSPDLLVQFWCLEEDVVLNLAHSYYTGGQGGLDEAGAGYMMNHECFVIEGGYPAYIDRVVKKTSYRFKNMDTYVVEAHFWGAPPGKKFFFLYYGELPERARRSAI